MDRYDILLGKKAPPPSINYYKKMIIGGRGSGKTHALLMIVCAYINFGIEPFLSIIGSQRNDIRNRLGIYYDRCKICSGFYERDIRGAMNLFLDNVDRYLSKLLLLSPGQNVIVTCNEDTFLSYYRFSQIPEDRILIINGMKWKLYKVEEILKKETIETVIHVGI